MAKAKFKQDIPSDFQVSTDEHLASENLESVYCDPCKFENTESEAYGFCHDCDEFLCQLCLQSHRKFKAFRDHGFLIGDAIPRGQKQGKEKLAFKLCDNHRINEVQFYCCDHKSVFCSLCKTAKHSTCDCKRISEICDSASNFKSTFDQTIKDMATMKKEFERLKLSDTERIDSIRAETQNCELQLKSMRQQMEMFFDDIEKDIASEQARNDKSVEDLRENIATYTDVVNHIISLNEQTEQVTKSKDKMACFAAQAKLTKLHAEYSIVKETIRFKAEKKTSNKLQMRIMEIQKECNKICNMVILKEPKLAETRLGRKEKQQEEMKEKKQEGLPVEKMTDHNKVASSLRKPNQHHTIKQEEAKDEQYNSKQMPITDYMNDRPHTKGVEGKLEKAKTLQLKYFADMKIKKKFLVSIKTDDTSSCNITSSLFLPDRSLMLCDNANSDILLLDKDFHVCDKLHLGGSPWDMALMNANEVVATLTEQKQLKYITKNCGKLHEGMSIHLKRTCWGISTYKGYLIITLHDNSGKGAIQIRTRKGEILRQIYPEDYGRDWENVVAPSYLCVNQSNGNIVVADGEKQHLMLFKFDGELLNKFEDDDIKWPKKVIFDEKGDCLVCASFASKLKLVKDNLQSKQDLWQDSDIFEKWLNQCRSPQTVSMRWDDLTMVVGHETRNQIQVFKCGR